MSEGSIPVNQGIHDNVLNEATHVVGGKIHRVVKIASGDENTVTPIDGDNPLPVALNSQKSAFGDLSVSELTPVFQYDFSYNINNKLWLEKNNGGSVSIDTNRVKLSTGAAANQSARLESRIPIKYRAGQGNICRFSALFTTGVSGSMQLAGVGDEGNGLFFGFDGANFGILRRYGGIKHVEEFQISAGAAETITITLDGQTTGNIILSGTNVTTAANEIVAYTDWALLGDGWDVNARGDTVVFKSFNAEPKSGSYSINSATSAGVFSIGILGVVETNSWVAQTAWNADKFDGTGVSGTTLDPTKGNVYQIQYQWLGFGRIYFYIEHPEDGALELVHSMDYANANLTPSFYSPTLPICFLAMNIANTTDLVVYSSSCAGFTEGKIAPANVHHASTNTQPVSITEKPLLTIHNKYLYAGKINRNRIKITYMNTESDTNKVTGFKYYLDAVLTDASYDDVDTADSMMSFDVAASAISGGDFQFGDSGELINLNDSTFYLYPGQLFTVTQKGVSGSSGNVSATINWEEEF